MLAAFLVHRPDILDGISACHFRREFREQVDSVCARSSISLPATTMSSNNSVCTPKMKPEASVLAAATAFCAAVARVAPHLSSGMDMMTSSDIPLISLTPAFT
jgi:hypothetical protein